jgi:hypothetical protein
MRLRRHAEERESGGLPNGSHGSHGSIGYNDKPPRSKSNWSEEAFSYSERSVFIRVIRGCSSSSNGPRPGFLT